MSVVWEIALTITILALNYVLIRVLAPPRIGVVPRLIGLRAGGRGRRLRLAVQSLERAGHREAFTITLRIVGHGEFLLTPSLFSGRQLEAYVGTQQDRDAFEVHGNAKRMEIRVSALRPMKTWVFDVPCTDDTIRVEGSVSGRNRQLGVLFPALKTLSDDVPSHQPGRFRFNWYARADVDSRAAAPLFGSLRVRGRSPWGRTFETNRVRAGVVVVAISVCGYALGALLLQQLGHVYIADPLLEVVAATPLVLALGLLHVLARPRWPIVAQGYLEPWWIKVKPLAEAAPVDSAR